ncbi:hypothetical protein Taro_030034, partial [Colocasia esculenta]|nr:hypothetical protein [Colocasia esculenta]
MNATTFHVEVLNRFYVGAAACVPRGACRDVGFKRVSESGLQHWVLGICPDTVRTFEVCVVFLDTLTPEFELYVRLWERRQWAATRMRMDQQPSVQPAAAVPPVAEEAVPTVSVAPPPGVE